jgi:hypothetical protein
LYSVIVSCLVGQPLLPTWFYCFPSFLFVALVTAFFTTKSRHLSKQRLKRFTLSAAYALLSRTRDTAFFVLFCSPPSAVMVALRRKSNPKSFPSFRRWIGRVSRWAEFVFAGSCRCSVCFIWIQCANSLFFCSLIAFCDKNAAEDPFHPKCDKPNPLKQKQSSLCIII